MLAPINNYKIIGLIDNSIILLSIVFFQIQNLYILITYAVRSGSYYSTTQRIQIQFSFCPAFTSRVQRLTKTKWKSLFLSRYCNAMK